MNLDRLLVGGLAALVGGILLGKWLHLSLAFLLVLGLIVLLLTFWQSGKFWRYGFYGLMVVIGLGIMAWAYLPKNELGIYENQSVVIQGQVMKNPYGKFYLVVAPKIINGRLVYSKAELVVEKKYGDETIYQRGETVVFEGVLEAFLPATNPGGFSEEGYWASQGIFHKLDATDLGQVMAPSQGIWRLTNALTAGIEANLAQYLDEATYQLVLGLLLGEKGALDQSFYSLSQKLGIAHVFAVSGLHVGFLVAFVLGFLRLFKWDKSWWAVIFLSVILGIYVLLTGLTPSAIRAAIMAILGLLAYKWLRFKDIYTIITIAALVILLSNPLALWAIGFQLSFVNTWGLIYFYPLAQKIWRFIPFKWLANGLSVAVAAQIASLPLVAYHFYMVAVFAPLFNLWVVPLIGVIVPFLLLGLCLSLVMPFLAEIIFTFAQGLLVLLTTLLDASTHFIGTGQVYVGQPGLMGIGLYFLIFIMLREGHFWWVKKPFLNGGIWLMLLCLVVSNWLPKPLAEDKMVFLDVGQGSSAVFQSKTGYVAVFDGGLGKDTTASYLRYSAINHVDVVILSHGDEDHTAGLEKLVTDFSIGYLILKEQDAALENLVGVLQLAKEKGVQLVLVKEKPIQLKLGNNIALEAKCYGAKSEDSNSREVVSVLVIGGRRVVFPGDLGKESIGQVVREIKGIDLWAVPHHGSKNSCYPDLYRQIAPDLAVVSAGRDNPYGHPHPDVLAALDEAEVPYGRTDQKGAIIVTFWPEGLKMVGFLR